MFPAVSLTIDVVAAVASLNPTVTFGKPSSSAGGSVSSTGTGAAAVSGTIRADEALLCSCTLCAHEGLLLLIKHSLSS